MRLARLFHFLALLALLLAPAGMLGSHAAMAMPHQPAASAMGHCAEKDAPSDQDRQQMLDCAIACTAMPSFAPLLAPEATCLRAAPVSSSIQLFEGTTPEAATPPPRFS